MNMEVLQGIVTQTDFLEAIAGDLPDAQTEEPEVKELADGSLLIVANLNLRGAATARPGHALGWSLQYACRVRSLLLGRIPAVGERIDSHGWSFEVSDMDGWRVNKAARPARSRGWRIL